MRKESHTVVFLASKIIRFLKISTPRISEVGRIGTLLYVLKYIGAGYGEVNEVISELFLLRKNSKRLGVLVL